MGLLFFLEKLKESFLFIIKVFPILMNGSLVAIEITIFSIFIGMVIGIIVAFLHIYGSKLIKKIIYFYEWVMRGTPILVILFFLYFGLPKIPLIGINLNPFVAVVIGLGLCSSGYQAQIYRGAILSIGSQQMEAGLSLGMTKFETFFNIILPQAVRLSLPGFTNEFTIVLKDSPLAYAVGISEILKNGRDIIVQTARPFEVYFAAAILYFVLFQLFYNLFKYISKKFEVPGFLISQ
ncbi:MAG: amino acid ABC transporter permease [Spirochaetes bacterium]|nr:amino acid ABC transporter permease [Spirochaetota bacterium]